METTTKGAITRGTTPTFDVEVDYNLTGFTCYLAIGATGRPRLKKSIACVDGGEEKSVASFKLTQADTMALAPGVSEWQMRCVKGETAIATGVGTVRVEDVIQYGELNGLD